METATSEYVWRPTKRYAGDANVTRLMRRHGIEDYFELVRRSQEDVEWFWDEVVSDGIDFFQPYGLRTRALLMRSTSRWGGGRVMPSGVRSKSSARHVTGGPG